MRNLARYEQIFAGYGSPGDIGRARSSPAIDARTIASSNGRLFNTYRVPPQTHPLVNRIFPASFSDASSFDNARGFHMLLACEATWDKAKKRCLT